MHRRLTPSGPMRRVALALGAVVVFGTLGLMWTEGWGPWEAFFVTLITITTVGYGDHGMSSSGERLISFVMIAGIGSATFLLGEIVRTTVSSTLNRERSMRKQIELLNGHVIVCGLGRVGMVVCETLHEASAPFVAVDADDQAVERARDRGFLAIAGDASEDRTLKDCGLDRASSLVAVSSSDASNIVITLSARDIRPDLDIYARVEHEDAIRKIKRAGATHIISPTLIGGRRIADAILRPHIVESLEMLGSNTAGVRVTEVHVEPDGVLAGKTFGDMSEEHASVVFIGVEHADGGVTARPDPSLALAAGDALIIAGEPEPLLEFIEHASPAAAAA